VQAYKFDQRLKVDKDIRKTQLPELILMTKTTLPTLAGLTPNQQKNYLKRFVKGT